MATAAIDPRIGRPYGDHGTHNQALDYALDHYPRLPDGDGDPATFLRAWREGDLDEFPEFYAWLADQVSA
jgi:hypothetical protein